MSNKGPEILDLDKLIAQDRIIKLAGKEINVTKIPSKITLKVVDKFEEIDTDNPESMDIVMDLAVDIINAQNDDKEITKEWLLKNTDVQQLIKMLEFIMEPIKGRISGDENSEEAGSGNPEK